MPRSNPYANFGFADDNTKDEELVAQNGGEPDAPASRNPYAAFGFDEAATPPVAKESPGFLGQIVDQLVAGTYDLRARHAQSSAVKKIADAGAVQRGELVIDEDSAAHKRMGPAKYRKTQEVEAKRAAEGRPANVESAEDRSFENEQSVTRLTDEAAGKLAHAQEMNTEASKRPMSPITQEFMDPKSKRGGWEIFLDDPVQIIADIGARSLPSSVEAAGVGALAAAGGPVGVGLGMGAASARQELVSTVMNQLQQRGVDTNNVAAIKAVFDDPAQMKDIMSAATKRSIAVGGFDALAGMFSGVMLSPFEGVIAKEATNLVAQGGVQAGLGAAGETVGQLAEGTDKLDPRAIAAEAAGEMVSAPVEVAAAAATGVREVQAEKAKGRELGNDIMNELENRNLGNDDSAFIDEEKHRARAEAAAAGGDALEQELAAARAGAEVSSKIADHTSRTRSERELELLRDPNVSGRDAARMAAGMQPAPVPESPKAELTPEQQRMADNRTKVDAEVADRTERTDYAASGQQALEDFKRDQVQGAAAQNYEKMEGEHATWRGRLKARRAAAAAHAEAEATAAAQRQRETATAEGQRELQIGEQAAKDAAATPTLAAVAPVELKEGKAAPIAAKPAAKPTSIKERRALLSLPKPQPKESPTITVTPKGEAGVPAGRDFGSKPTPVAPLPETKPPRQTAKVKEATLKAKREARAASRPARVEAVRTATEAAVAQHKGVNYYASAKDAEAVAADVRKEHPGARVVEYGRGHAVQYYKSGPYYPEAVEPNSKFNPANHEAAVQEAAVSTNNVQAAAPVVGDLAASLSQESVAPATVAATEPVEVNRETPQGIAAENTPRGTDVAPQEQVNRDNQPSTAEEKPGRPSLRERRQARKLKRVQYRLADHQIVEHENDTDEGFALEGFDEEGAVVSNMEVQERNDGRLQIKIASAHPFRQGEGIGQQMLERAVANAKAKGKELVSDRVVSARQLRVYEALKRKGWTIEYSDPAKVAEALTKAAAISSAPDADIFKASTNNKLDMIGARMPGDVPVVKTIKPPSVAAPVERNASPGTTERPSAAAEPVAARLGEEEKPRGVPLADAQKAAAPLVEELKAMKPQIHASLADAPADVKAQVERDGVVNPKAVYDAETGEIHVFADAHKSTDDIIETLLHEGVAHKGLRYLLGDDFDAKLTSIGATIRNSIGLARVAKRYGYDLKNPAQLVQAVDEYIAELAEKGSEASFLQRVYDMVRAALRGLGIVKEWSDNDLRALLRESRANLREKGGSPRTSARAAYRVPDRLREWFGKSVVKNDDGSPRVVYHGTRAGADFDTFTVDGPVYNQDREEHESSGSGADPTSFFGAHFAKESRVANLFAGGIAKAGNINQRVESGAGRVLPVYLKLENPMLGTEAELHEFIWQNGTLPGADTDFYFEELEANEGENAVEKEGAVLDGPPSRERAQLNHDIFDKMASMQEDEGVEMVRELAYTARMAAERLGYDGAIYKNEVEGGTSYTVFQPNQIKSAVGNNGAYSSSDNRIQYRLEDEKQKPEPSPLSALHNIAATMEAQKGDKSSVTDKIKSVMANTAIGSQRALLGAIPRRNLVDFVDREKMPALARYIQESSRMDGRRNQLMSEAEPIGRRWNKFTSKNKQQGARLAELMHAATLAGVDPSEAYQPSKDLVRDAKRRGDFVILRKAFERLSPEAHEIFRQARDYYIASRQRVMDALETRINASNASGQTKKALISKLREQFESGRVEGPYFPLMRFGDYWAAAKDSGDEIVSFTRFETPSGQRQWVENMKKQGFKIEQGQRVLDKSVVETVSPGFAAQVTDLVQKTGDKGLADEIWQLYLRTLPELSMRKAFMHRKGRLGFSADALRAFGHAAFHGAHQTARLENMHILENSLEAMRGQAAQLSNADDKERYWATNVFAEMENRHEWAKNPAASPWATALTSLGFAWYLGTTPAAAMVNLTQTPMVALPVLGAQFGMTKTAIQLARAGTLWASTRGPLKNKLRGDERRAFEEADRIGLFDKTQAHDLAGIAEHGLSYSSKWRATVNVMSYLFHKTESANRETTFLAAYRLAREKGVAHEAAILKSEELTWDSHFDYANTNRPRYVRGNVAKVLFLFKNYSINMTYRLVRDFNDSLRGATKEQRRTARVRFGGLMMQTSLLAGLTGLPVVWTVARILESAFDEPDDPYDAEEAFYAYLVQRYGSKVAMAMMRGPVDALLGGTLSSRISLSNLWLREPDASLETNEMFSHYMGELAGPVAGIAEQAGQAGIAYQKTGDPFRALEYLMPKVLEDQLKVMRFLREGARNYRGESYVDPQEFTKKDLFLQSLGFVPSRLQQRYDENKGIRNTEARILQRKQVLMDQLFAAARNKDRKGVAEAAAAIRVFNHTNPAAEISSETIMSSAASRQAIAEQTLRGVRVSSDRMRFLHRRMQLTDKEAPDDK